MGLGSILGSVVGGLFGSHSAKKQQEQAAKLQIQNWREMQSTAHQREVEDLRSAGLNPILSATGGQIASPGAAPVGSDVSGMSSLGHVITNALKADMQNKIEQGKLENQKLQLEIDRFRADTNAKEVDSKIKLNNLLGVESASKALYNDKLIEKANVDIRNSKELLDAQKSLMAAQGQSAMAAAGSFAAQAVKYYADAGVGYKQQQILEREIKYGAIAGKYLGKGFLDELSHDPAGTVTKYADKIVDVLRDRYGEVGTAAAELYKEKNGVLGD